MQSTRHLVIAVAFGCTLSACDCDELRSRQAYTRPLDDVGVACEEICLRAVPRINEELESCADGLTENGEEAVICTWTRPLCKW